MPWSSRRAHRRADGEPASTEPIRSSILLGAINRTNERQTSVMSSWPEHEAEAMPWRGSSRGGTRDDRMFSEVISALPPAIADLDSVPTMATAQAGEEALALLARSDQTAVEQSAAMSRFLIRTESVASSKIERIEASAEDFARTLREPWEFVGEHGRGKFGADRPCRHHR